MNDPQDWKRQARAAGHVILGLVEHVDPLTGMPTEGWNEAGPEIGRAGAAQVVLDQNGRPALELSGLLLGATVIIEHLVTMVSQDYDDLSRVDVIRVLRDSLDRNTGSTPGS